MPATTTFRENHSRTSLGDAWRLHKIVSGYAREARCELWSHEYGWELFLIVDGCDLRRSQVCRGSDELLSISEAWKSALIERGWTGGRDEG